ncbi:MAG: hypothetical protein HC817_11960 [Saprospiraceae bacterium]|nr:hypothetical protein [Saprospiraceae bacterium]
MKSFQNIKIAWVFSLVYLMFFLVKTRKKKKKRVKILRGSLIAFKCFQMLMRRQP